MWNGQPDNRGLFHLVAATGIGLIEAFEADGDGAEIAEVNLINPGKYSTGLTSNTWVLSINSPYFELNQSSVKSIANYAINNKAAYVVASLGKGLILLTGPHPEIEEDSDSDGFSYFDRFEDPESEWLLVKRLLKKMLLNIEMEEHLKGL